MYSVYSNGCQVLGFWDKAVCINRTDLHGLAWLFRFPGYESSRSGAGGKSTPCKWEYSHKGMSIQIYISAQPVPSECSSEQRCGPTVKSSHDGFRI